MRGLSAVLLSALAGCSAGPGKLPGETEARCIHRLYDYPTRSQPFQTAASLCAGDAGLDLTGDRYYQLLASSLNVPFVSHDPRGSDGIVLTGSRLAQPTDQPAPPELRLR